MQDLRDELEKVSLKTYYLENLSELMCDFFYNNLSEIKYAKGDALVTVINEKIKDLDSSLQEVFKKINDVEREIAKNEK